MSGVGLRWILHWADEKDPLPIGLFRLIADLQISKSPTGPTKKSGEAL